MHGEEYDRYCEEHTKKIREETRKTYAKVMKRDRDVSSFTEEDWNRIGWALSAYLDRR